MHDSLIELFGFTFLIPAHGKQILLSALLGFVIGIERAAKGKPASIRTFSIISTGSCLFTVMSIEASGGAVALPHDVTRIAAQIVTGVGFLGGGVIFKTTDRIEGITTAAMIWLTAAIGMGCGFNQIQAVLWSFVAGICIHLLSNLLHPLFPKPRVQLDPGD